MPDQVEAGQPIILDLVVLSGQDLDADPVVTITDPDAVDHAAGTGTHVAPGRYTITFAVPADGPLGEWVVAWDGFLNAFEFPAYDAFLVVVAPTPAAIDSLVCAPWLQPSEFVLCTTDDFDSPDVFALVCAAANDLLYLASAQQFPGVCTDTIWPNQVGPLDRASGGGWGAPSLLNDGSWWVPWWTAAGGNAPAFVGGFGCPSFDVVPGSIVPGALPSIIPPNTPIVDVTEILVDGVALDAGSWRIVDDRWIIPADAGMWPLFNRYDLADTEAGTWTVTYTYGTAPPAAGLLALQVLVCELGKAFRNDKTCRLPRRMTSMVRENLSMVVIDPFTFLDQGRFGIYEVDTFLAQTNPAGLQMPARVVSARLNPTTAHHVR